MKSNSEHRLSRCRPLLFVSYPAPADDTVPNMAVSSLTPTAALKLPNQRILSVSEMDWRVDPRLILCLMQQLVHGHPGRSCGAFGNAMSISSLATDVSGSCYKRDVQIVNQRYYVMEAERPFLCWPLWVSLRQLTAAVSVSAQLLSGNQVIQQSLKWMQ